MGTLGKHLRRLGIALAVIAYPVLAHYSTTTTAARELPALGVLTALAPALGILAWLAWNPRRPLVMLLLAFAVGLALWATWPLLLHNFDWLYFLQHAGTNLALAVAFGMTLLPGRKPLVSLLAEKIRGSLSPAVASYTRRVTLAWSIFFAVVCLTSVLLFFLAEITTWSVFANFLTLPLALLMFVAEYLLRLRILRHEPQHSFKEGILVYWNNARTDHSTVNPS